MDRTDLQQLTKEQLIELVIRLQRPDKTSQTSSKPPSTDRKQRRFDSKPGGAKPGHKGHSRDLSDRVDDVFDYKPDVCLGCGAAFSGDEVSALIGEYDTIDLPPILPHVTRHQRFSCQCAACGMTTDAPVPAAAKGTPFGPRIHALAIYLKTFQALSYERLQAVFLDLYGLVVSQGAIMNMFRRTRPSFQTQADKAVAALRVADVVASDETGVRIEGTNSQHWVFVCETAVVHQPDYTRAGSVIRDMMDGHQPTVWISDRYSAQQNNGLYQQTCLAHLVREVKFAHENGEDDLPMRLKLWFGRAFDLAEDITKLAKSTVDAKRRKLEREMDAILNTKTTCDLAMKIKGRISRARDQLLVFCDYPGKVEATNNACERALRPAVIQRKVTNGYRAMWAAGAEANVRTTVATAGLTGKRTFQTILAVLA
jgi:transposase